MDGSPCFKKRSLVSVCWIGSGENQGVGYDKSPKGKVLSVLNDWSEPMLSAYHRVQFQ
ncbi:hypothetical protein MED297_19202 [Reinekea sp. MED297]|uniref:Uncharacterized protein n=1 Tax=Reinekea blandensis MED297 TaxID=314283 RepID=A4B8U5_9GAMM|nr:hypothetical protein MED297_19202 [Reinekea sp. MED297] [Reinekea blandensis MED297]